jgi:hypothetical protein
MTMYSSTSRIALVLCLIVIFSHGVSANKPNQHQSTNTKTGESEKEVADSEPGIVSKSLKKADDWFEGTIAHDVVKDIGYDAVKDVVKVGAKVGDAIIVVGKEIVTAPACVVKVAKESPESASSIEKFLRIHGFTEAIKCFFARFNAIITHVQTKFPELVEKFNHVVPNGFNKVVEMSEKAEQAILNLLQNIVAKFQQYTNSKILSALQKITGGMNNVQQVEDSAGEFALGLGQDVHSYICGDTGKHDLKVLELFLKAFTADVKVVMDPGMAVLAEIVYAAEVSYNAATTGDGANAGNTFADTLKADKTLIVDVCGLIISQVSAIRPMVCQPETAKLLADSSKSKDDFFIELSDEVDAHSLVMLNRQGEDLSNPLHWLKEKATNVISSVKAGAKDLIQGAKDKFFKHTIVGEKLHDAQDLVVEVAGLGKTGVSIALCPAKLFISDNDVGTTTAAHSSPFLAMQEIFQDSPWGKGIFSLVHAERIDAVIDCIQARIDTLLSEALKTTSNHKNDVSQALEKTLAAAKSLWDSSKAKFNRVRTFVLEYLQKLSGDIKKALISIFADEADHATICKYTTETGRFKSIVNVFHAAVKLFGGQIDSMLSVAADSLELTLNIYTLGAATSAAMVVKTPVKLLLSFTSVLLKAMTAHYDLNLYRAKCQ